MLTGELSQFIIERRQKTFSIKVNHCQSVCLFLLGYGEGSSDNAVIYYRQLKFVYSAPPCVGACGKATLKWMENHKNP